MGQMEEHEIESRINRNLIIGWEIIVGILLVAYLGEFFKGQRTTGYIIAFASVTAIPAILCSWIYKRNNQNRYLRYLIISGYFIMYVFALLTTNTTLVFTYILPFLSLIVLYHQPQLVLIVGLGSLIANLIFIGRRILNHEINVETSKEIEIQIALLFLCFGFLYVASRLYDRISKDNDSYLKELGEKQKQLQRVTLQTIMTIANIIDAKDEYTKGHSQRVAEYSAAIAEAMGYDEERVKNVRYIGLLHDIGKIGIPDAILNKPGRLTDEEYELMKQHVVIGGNILKDNRMIRDLSDGARYHHERYDGKGYVQQLAGEEIPEIARIIGLADAYDAMTSNRVYRKRLTDEQVIEELTRYSGSQFDPNITGLFIDLLKKGKIMQLSPDQDMLRAEDINSEKTPSIEEQSTRLLQSILKLQSANDRLSTELDPLTGAYNRTVGEKRIAARLTEEDGALILVDIANLREVNSRQGFIGGDYLIRYVAEELKAFRYNITVVRYGGDEFICYLDNIRDTAIMESILEELYGRIRAHLREKPEYKKVLIYVSGALSTTVSREYIQLFAAVDKAMYYIKRLHKGGWYLYESVDRKVEENENLSKKELEHLMENIMRESSYEGTYQVDYPEFIKIYEFVKSICERNHQNTQLILMTLQPVDEKLVTLQERDEAMKCMEQAIHRALRKVDISMRFSSTQQLIFLMNLDKEQIEQVTSRVMSNFYKSCDKRTMTLTYDVAELKAKQETEQQ